MVSWFATRRVRGLTAGLGVAGFALAGCDRDSATTSPPVPLSRRIASLRSVTPARQIVTPDHVNDSIASHVPGFGGYYVDESRRLVIWAMDTSRGPEIRQWIHQFVPAPELDALPLIVRKGSFDVRDLRRWKRGLEELPSATGWLAADVDERANRVWFGVESQAAAQKLRSSAAAAGIPTGSVTVDVVSGNVVQTPDNYSISTGVRPLTGGVGIGLNQYSLGSCTFGFLVRLDTTSSNYYGVSASHCTPTLDANDHETWWQYEDSTFDDWYEAPFASTLAHGLTQNPCPSGYTCRYADAVLFKVPSSFTNLAFGKIVATTDSTQYYSGGAGSTLVDQSVSPYRSYTVYTETTSGSFHVGDVVHRTGIGSGHSYGPVYRTCVDMVPGNHIPPGGSRTGSLYVCQMVANTYVFGGDSGGPVFDNVNGFTILEGVVWYHYVDSTGDYMAFSPIDGIHWDLGPFVAYPGGSYY